MKNKLIFYVCINLLLIVSCEDPITEGVTFNPLEFRIEHFPDTNYIKINDTLNFYTAIPNLQNLEGGKVNVKTSYGYDTTIPITTSGNTLPSLNNSDYTILSNSVFLTSNEVIKDKILGLYTYPQNDSIRFEFKIVFHKKGTHGILLSPSFYEGKDGKARVSAKFKSNNLGWNLYQNGYPVPTLGDDDYYNKLTIAVTD